jgi:hypothetical protein
LLNQYAISLLFVEHKENWFNVVFRDSYFVFDIGYDFEDSRSKRIIVNCWLLCKVTEHSEHIWIVRLVC